MNQGAADIADTLQERGTRYGEFDGHARITQNIKRAMRDSKNWDSLPDDMKEALEMIAHKAGRILNGDPNYADSWVDIAGYAKLVADRLEAAEKQNAAKNLAKAFDKLANSISNIDTQTRDVAHTEPVGFRIDIGGEDA